MDENTTADNVVALNNVVVENSAAAISHVASSAVVAAISLAEPFLMFYHRRHCSLFFRFAINLRGGILNLVEFMVWVYPK